MKDRVHIIRDAMATLAVALAIALATPSAADPAAFVERFTGAWSGGGMVMEDGMARPQRVSCRLEGREGPASFTMAGRCRAMVVFSRAIAANVSYDPATGQFRGTYEGSRAGTAQLEGEQQGDALQLSVVWPRPVHGDPRGRMTIVPQGDDGLRIVVEHPFAPTADGQTIRSADLVLTRQ